MSLRATRAEIDLSAFSSNIAFFREKINAEKICLAVKSNAYGHGLVAIAKAGVENGIDYLAVATIDEGINLREEGVTIPILVLSPFVKREISLLFKYKLTPFLTHIDYLDQIILYAQQYKYPLPIHIKIDTGMNRSGFKKEDFLEAFSILKNTKEITIEGIGTHFSSADEDTVLGKTQTDKQIQNFNEILDLIKDQLSDNIIIHAANTGGIINYPNSHFNMVRLGLGAYGYPLSSKGILKPVLSLRTQVVHSQKIKKGEVVSYGATWKAFQDTCIALLPIGYGDGYPRLLSDKGQVKIEENYYPIIGRICMDLTIINTGNVLIPKETEVLMFGNDALLNAEFLGESINSISYEMLTSISERVPRIYY